MRINPMYIFEALLALIQIAERFFKDKGQGEQKKAFVLNGIETAAKLAGQEVDPNATAGMVDQAVAMIYPKEKPKSRVRDFTKPLNEA